jgi:hypothetical protein
MGKGVRLRGVGRVEKKEKEKKKVKISGELI